MKRNRIPQFLARQALFATLTPEERERVASRMEVLDLEEGEPVFEEGDACDGWYVVVSGSVDVEKSTDGGMPHELAHLEAGEGFGEMGLIDDAPRLATVVAAEPTTVARLPRDTFHALLDEASPVGAHIILAMAKVLCRRQRELTAILTDLVDDPETAAPGPREMMAMLLLSGREA